MQSLISEMEDLVATHLTESLTGDKDGVTIQTQLKNEPSRLVRATIVHHKLFVTLAVCAILFFQGVKDLLTSETVMAQITRLLDIYVNTTSKTCTHDKEI